MPSKPSHPLSVNALFWRSVNRLRGVKIQAESPHTTRWRLVRLYFEDSRNVGGLRTSVLHNFAERIQDGRLSIPGAEKLPPKLLQDLVRMMKNDGVFLARLIIKGRNPRVIKLAAQAIEENVESHEAAAETFLRNKIPESGLFMKRKIIKMIAQEPTTSEKMVAKLLNELIRKTLTRKQLVSPAIGQVPMSAEEQAALGKDPTITPSEFTPVTEKIMGVVKIYSTGEIKTACDILAHHPKDTHENILEELAYFNAELADLMREQLGMPAK